MVIAFSSAADAYRNLSIDARRPRAVRRNRCRRSRSAVDGELPRNHRQRARGAVKIYQIGIETTNEYKYRWMSVDAITSIGTMPAPLSARQMPYVHIGDALHLVNLLNRAINHEAVPCFILAEIRREEKNLEK